MENQVPFSVETPDAVLLLESQYESTYAQRVCG